MGRDLKIPMTAAEYIASELSRRGVRYVFGIPGGPSIPYIEALRNQGIEFILTANEASAGIMADVTGRITGIPGICHATFGPGAVNLASGVGGALLDRSPVIAFTSEVPDAMTGRTSQMNINHQELFRPLTKRTCRLSPDNIGKVLPEAFSLALEEYPGPVHLGLPSDLADSKIPGQPQHPGLPEKTIFTADREKLEEFIKKSRRPLLAIGLTSRRIGISGKLLQFLEKHPMPAVITPMAKGILPEGHPCYAGVLFHALSGKLAAMIEQADLVIGLGYDPVEFNFEEWMPDVPLVSLNTIQIDMPGSLDNIQAVGDLAAGLDMLSGLMEGRFPWGFEEVSTARREIEFEIDACGRGFGPVAAFQALMDELPEETIVTSDVGSHLHLLGQVWKTRSPEKLLMTNGWSSMGFGLPAAIAAQLNCPGLPVVCISGDGGFLMVLGELITARRYRLPLIVVVMADKELNLIRLKQSWKGVEPAGTGLYSGELFRADRILGVKILRAGNMIQMRKAVKIAVASREPMVIEALIDPADYARLISSPE